MIGKTAACVFVRVSACKLCGNLCVCIRTEVGFSYKPDEGGGASVG